MNGENSEFGRRNVFSVRFVPPVPDFEASWGEGQRPEAVGRVEVVVPGAPTTTVAPLNRDVLITPTQDTRNRASDAEPAPRDQL